MKGQFISNLETGKLELHFTKADYLALPEADKSSIKSRFLFSGRSGCWVSRSTHSHYWPLEVAKKLGLEDGGETGQRLSFAEQQAAIATKAGERAERMEEHAENAAKRAAQAFDRADLSEGKSGIPFGQPILVGHHSERRHRRAIERADNAMRKGIEETDKAAYFERRAENAAYTASQSDLTDKRYLQNRIDEQEKNIRDCDRRLKGEGWAITQEYIDRVTVAKAGYQERLDYYKKAMADCGGVQFSKANVKAGDWVKVRYGWERVVKANTKTVSSQGTIMPFPMKHPWAEVKEHKPASELKPAESV